MSINSWWLKVPLRLDSRLLSSSTMWSFSYSHTLFFFNLTHTHAATNKGQVLDSMKSSVLTVEAASDFFHKMVAMKSLPRVKGSNLLFGIIAKMKHYATAISLIKHVFRKGQARYLHSQHCHQLYLPFEPRSVWVLCFEAYVQNWHGVQLINSYHTC